jgi:hypothetical protein
MTAREYMLASRDFGKRNLMIHVVQGTGAIMSAMVPFTGPFVKQFSGVYSGAFAGALTTVFPDHNTEQLKLIDDEGFSNSRTDRTVVPKSGTAEFVIFVSAKEFEEGWWTEKCAEKTVIVSGPAQPKRNRKDEVKCVGAFNQASPDPRCVEAEIGIDLDAARRVCVQESVVKTVSTVEAKGDEDGKPELTYFTPRVTHYRDWSQKAVAIFRELSLAVVAGTHVRESSDSTPTLTKVDCSPHVDDKGDIKLDSAKDGVIACTLSGANLDKVAQLKLRNYQDATDTKTADGTVSTSGDSKSAKVSFSADKLGQLTASAYKVYTVTKDGVEGGGDLLLHFDSATPVLTAGPEPASIDLGKLKAKDAAKIPIALKGFHLDKVTSAHLTGAKLPIDLPVDGAASSSTITVSLSPGDLSKIDAKYTTNTPLRLSISLQTSTKADPYITDKVLVCTGDGTVAAVAKPVKKPVAAKASPVTAAPQSANKDH